jgi:iron complex outermembrane receptor protein
MHRDYKIEGAELLAPPTEQNSIAFFTAQNYELEKTRLSFGARVENNRYSPTGQRSRSFTGVSVAAGLSHRLWKDGAFVANYSHSYRAPALEDFTTSARSSLTFEIGSEPEGGT